ncbi:MAG TPA: helix-turn-helix domain-containing protein [Pirellulaceae bacterium]|nr:helix-turn-helix domain-containing protein [Pirellulaceae bacterium]
MTTATLDRIVASRSYETLVSRFPPRPIREPGLLKQTYAVIDRLMAIPHPSPFHLEFLELLSTLVEDYESVHYPTPVTSTESLLAHLIESRGVTQTQVAKETGISPSIISDVLAGRRSLSLPAIVKLSQYFRLDPGAFLRVARDM